MPEICEQNKEVNKLKSTNKRLSGQLLYFLQEEELVLLDIINSLKWIKRAVEYNKKL